MWEYKTTDYKNDFLRHADHKYIRKYMKNGKWRYEYSDSNSRIYDPELEDAKLKEMESEEGRLRDEARRNDQEHSKEADALEKERKKARKARSVRRRVENLWGN